VLEREDHLGERATIDKLFETRRITVDGHPAPRDVQSFGPPAGHTSRKL